MKQEDILLRITSLLEIQGCNNPELTAALVYKEVADCSPYEHIATVQLPDPLDERDGVYYDISDRERLQQLKAGDKLYVIRNNPMTLHNQKKVDEFTTALINKAVTEGNISFPEEG